MSSTICNGCGVPFHKTHLLKNHRKSQRCGGFYLSADEKSHQADLLREKAALERHLQAVRSAANYESYPPTGQSI